MKKRCSWLTYKSQPSALDIQYHDEEWGVPIFDDRLLFEFLILEGAQAGLSWTTILKKRDNYRYAFDNFEPEIIAQYDDNKVQELLNNEGIVRNKLKIHATILNAKNYLKIQKEYGSFRAYIWSFVKGKTIQNTWNSLDEIPVKTAESDAMSKDLKKRGFKFIGSTICYAYMQATGMVNDHIIDCFRHDELRDIAK